MLPADIANELHAGLSRCLSDYLIPSLPGETLGRVIDLTIDRERYAGDIAPVVIQNSVYSQFVMRVDFLQKRVKEWVAEVPQDKVNYELILERIFILLGKQASRNLIASIRLARIGNILPRKKNERFSPNPKEQLKHALACEEFCTSRNYASSDLAFLAGLQYDLLQTNLMRLKVPREVLNAFGTHFPEALRTAHFAYEISSRMGSFPHSEYAFPAALTLGLGKVLAYAIYPKEGVAPSYAKFLAEVEKKKVFKWEWATDEEKKRFPLRPSEISSISALNFGFMKKVEPAIRFSEEAYFLKRVQPKFYPLALVLGFAQAAASGRTPSPMAIERLRAMRINPKILADAAAAVSGKGSR